MEIKDIIKLIDEDIKYQNKLLVGNFEKDKPIHWRIIGMKRLKKTIEITEEIENEGA